MFVSRMLRITMLAALFMPAYSGAVICHPGQAYYRYVGNTAGDHQCTDDDIQSAIDNTVCPNTTIVITREHLYTNQALSIDNKSLTMIGVGDGVMCGFPVCDPSTGPCDPPPTQPVVTINGGQPNKRVLTITGSSNVTLKYIEITLGSIDSSQRGGGIFVDDAGSGGSGVLTLDTVTVDHNTAGYGGGISVSPTTFGSGKLTLLSNTLILENTAINDGGGIRIENGASLYAIQPQTLIGYNKTLNGYGGGIVAAQGYVDIGSPGYNGGAVLQYNNAQAGGGAIAAFIFGNVRLFTTDAQHPVQVSNNSTEGLGGAIYLKGVQHDPILSDYAPRACLFNYQINDNIGVTGAAIYADFDPDDGYSIVDLNPSDECGVSGSLAAEGAVDYCAVPCNQMYGNIAENPANNQPTGGSVIGVSSSYFRVNNLDLRHSSAGDLIEQAVPSTVRLNTCVFADNHTQHELIGASYLTIDNCTMANNTIDDGYVLYVPSDGTGGGGLQLANSIIDQPANSTLDYGGNPSSLKASDLMLLDAGLFPVVDSSIVAAEPTFVDAANGDYHLQAISWGIDFAPQESGGPSTDLDGNPRNIDLLQVPNLLGPRDLGAYERQYVCTADTVFCDGFDGYQ